MFRPCESIISISLIYNTAFGEGGKKKVTWFLNIIFQVEKDSGLWNLSNYSSDICCLCCPVIEFHGISIDIKELANDDFLANVDTGITSSFFVISRERVPCPCNLWNWSSFSWDSIRMISWIIKVRKLIIKNVLLLSRCMSCVKRHTFNATQYITRTWNHYRLTWDVELDCNCVVICSQFFAMRIRPLVVFELSSFLVFRVHFGSEYLGKFFLHW